MALSEELATKEDCSDPPNAANPLVVVEPPSEDGFGPSSVCEPPSANAEPFRNALPNDEGPVENDAKPPEFAAPLNPVDLLPNAPKPSLVVGTLGEENPDEPNAGCDGGLSESDVEPAEKDED